MKNKFNKIITIVVFSLFLCLSITAQDNLQKGIELYKSGNYKSSVKVLQKVNKNDRGADLGLYYLGLAYEKQDKLRKALKAYKQSISLNSEFAPSKTGVAYVYLKSARFRDAIRMAKESVLLDPKNYRAYYILGNAYYLLDKRQIANKYLDKLIEMAKQSVLLDSKDYRAYYILGNAYYLLDKRQIANKYLDKLIEIKPDFADAYLMKYYVHFYSQYIDKRKKSVRYKEGLNFLSKYISLSENLSNKEFWEKQQESLKYFVKHFEQKELEEENKTDKDAKTTGIKILKKSAVGYNVEARRARINGTIRVLVAFQSNGSIEHVLLIKGLGYGLDEKAIKQAKKIKFKPPTKNGKPFTITKVVQYSFRRGL